MLTEHENIESSNLTRVRAELLELQSEEDPTGRPTPYAFRRTWELLFEAGKQMKLDFPYGYVMEDGEGGIRIEWENQSRYVRLIVPAEQDGQQYIYYQNNDTRDIDEVSANALAGWLYWLATK
jgi:hypothetical protein